MQRRIGIGLTVLLLLMIGALSWQVLWEGEPVYQGKKLDVWLVQYGTNHFPTVRGGPLGQQAEAAIRQIGTNAIPIYLKMVTTRDPSLKLKVIALVPDQWLTRVKVRSVHDFRLHGAFGLIALGEDAKSAFPTLIALLNDQDEDVRFMAGFTLESLGPVAGDALFPLVKTCLEDPDVLVQSEAIRILGQIHQPADQVIALLVEVLAKPKATKHSVEIRTDAMRALRQFGAQAKPAVPKLVEFLNDSDSVIRSAATNALKKIDAIAAAREGIK